MKFLKSRGSPFILRILLIPLASLMFSYSVSAASFGDVVINEIAYEGTIHASTDEWIELYNNSSQDVDISGWTLEDDGSSIQLHNVTIPANGFLILADSNEVFQNFQDVEVISMSLANSGDSLELFDQNYNLIDSVNSSGGAWFAGGGDSSQSMERKDPNLSGDDESNWESSLNKSVIFDFGGNQISGSPASLNSVFSGQAAEVSLTILEENYQIGDIINLQAVAKDADEVLGYAFDLNYAPDSFKLIDVSQGHALSLNGDQTSFNSALENGQEGRLVIGEARINPNTPISINENVLFTATFEVIDNTINQDIFFGADSYLFNGDGN